METKSKNAIVKFQQKLQKVMIPVATKLDNQRHLSALKEGLSMTIPFTVIGGLFIILAQPPVDPTKVAATNFFFKFLLAWHAWAAANINILLLPYNLTLGFLSVYAVFGISYSLAGKYDLNKVNTALSSLFVFLVVSLKVVNNNISIANLGAGGLFTAILVGLLTVEISRLLRDKNIRIKMPEQVPDMVAAPFENLIPALVNVLVFMGINGLLSLVGTSIPNIMVSLLTPILSVSDSLPAILLIVSVSGVLWFFGIHGDNVTSPVVTPIITANVALNAAAVAAGHQAPHIYAGFFATVYGGWCTFPALVMAMLVISKSVRLKTLARAAIVPDFFNINEPLVFGVPTVMNIPLIIPILVMPLVNLTIAYSATAAGLIGRFYINAPWTTPGFISAFLSTMDWKASVLWILLYGLDFLVWIIFLKGYDNLLIKEESQSNEQ